MSWQLTGSREDRPTWAPSDIDLERPNVARVYDYYLGGGHNFAADRQMADQAIADWPELPRIMRANRAFLRRAVRYLVAAGVRQFLDLGSGIPTSGNVHQVAQAADPSCRVAYVDIDPVAVVHSQALLAGDRRVVAIHGDLRQPARLLDHPDVHKVLDLSRPVAVLMIAVLHFVSDADDPAGIIAAYRDAVVPGSYLAVCHATHGERQDRAATHQAMYRRTGKPMTMRTRDQVAALLSGFDLVDPGLVYMASWRPGEDDDRPERPEMFPGYAAVAAKPEP